MQYYQRKLKGLILLDVKVNKVVINNWKKGLGLTQVMKSSGQMLFVFLRPNNDKHVSDISTMCHALVHASLGMHSPTGGWKRVQKRRVLRFSCATKCNIQSFSKLLTLALSF